MLLLVLTALLAFLLTLDLSAAARFLLVLVGAALGLPLFLVLLAVLVNPAPPGVRLPAGTRPADLRAARRVLRSGELTGLPEADRVARILAAQVLRQRLWLSLLLLCGFGALNLFNALNRYTSDGAWSGTSVFFLATGLVFVVIVVVAVPSDLRSRRRARAVADAHDARARSRSSTSPPRVSDW